MYLRILKKDLKRKKTMNVILLLFVILASMFAASSVNNIIAVYRGIDGYLDKAGVGDYCIVSRDRGDQSKIKDILDNKEYIIDYKCEEQLLYTTSKLIVDDKRLDNANTWAFIMPQGNVRINLFDKDNKKLTSVDRGEAWVTTPLEKEHTSVGDSITITVGSREFTYKIKGFAKDAVFGAGLMDNPRIVLNDEDYAEIMQNKDAVKDLHTSIYYIRTDNVSQLKTDISTISESGIIFDADRKVLKSTYIMDMLVAILLLILSVCLILVSFVVLRFTIGFTISEEFREIGVMKAMGIKNSSIRLLYLVKYIALAIVGSMIGFGASISFGKYMLDKVSTGMVLTSDNSILTGLLCSLAVVLLILLFSWTSTAKIKKLSPIDAVRCGQTGERFRKKAIIRVGKSRLGTTGFLAANDVLSSPKTYGIITAVFTLCALIMMLLGTVSNTLNSRKMIHVFNVTESDAFLELNDRMFDVMSGSVSLESLKDEIEDTLEENDMPGEVRVELMYKIPVYSGNNRMLIHVLQCKETDTSDYVYTEGTPPVYENEIAISNNCADHLEAGIGDKIKLDVCGEQQEYIVTALFDTMIMFGEAARLNTVVDIPEELWSSYFQMQIDFSDDPGKHEIKNRIEKLKDIYGDEKAFDADTFVAKNTGVTDILNAMDKFVMVLSVTVILMITILMERSFIAKEKSEIALMKAVGFKSRSIIVHHILRFVIVTVVSSILGAALLYPVIRIAIDPIFKMLGAGHSMCYAFSLFRLLILYPAVTIGTAAVGTLLTALYTKTIKASDTADIE